MQLKQILLNFIYKFFCVLKGANEGLIVQYIGGKKFKFVTNVANTTTPSPTNDINQILAEYTKKLDFLRTI